ncbi:nitrous oxide reductase accessory protein NosL [Rhodobacter sp. NSM]|uniref:nitrous oxide reductase accessory protein NosL n=1 Tax=Rhodobacter sp. NSM TaxID=3457501 RepID=UPI003FD14B17
MKRVLALALLLAACRDEAMRPDPVAMTPEAVGHFCQMNLLEHPGPKAQVHLQGQPQPLFFSQVRDAIAYMRMPEQEGIVTALYVSDMGAAESWADPGATNWIAEDEAIYVVGSDAEGGMGSPEIVPFGSKAGAERFAAEHGGRLAGLATIPDADIIGAARTASEDEGDYAGMLRRLAASRQE